MNESVFLLRAHRSKFPAVKVSPGGSFAIHPSNFRVAVVLNSSKSLLYDSVGICGRRETCCTTSPQRETISIQNAIGLIDELSSGDRGILFRKFWKYGTVAYSWASKMSSEQGNRSKAVCEGMKIDDWE